MLDQKYSTFAITAIIIAGIVGAKAPPVAVHYAKVFSFYKPSIKTPTEHLPRYVMRGVALGLYVKIQIVRVSLTKEIFPAEIKRIAAISVCVMNSWITNEVACDKFI